MPDFKFKAIDAQGQVVNGSSTAADAEALARILHGQGLFLMESTEDATAPKAGADTRPLMARMLAYRFRGRIKAKDIAFFTAQLSIMVRSALPLMEALTILAEYAPNDRFRDLLKDIQDQVGEGCPLSAAFARHPKVFDKVYLSLLAAGEASGDMETMLGRLTAYLDFSIQMKSKIRSALLYPVIVLLTACSVIGFVVVFVLPTFMEVFVQLNIQLPWPTRLLLLVSEAVRTWWYVAPIMAAAFWSGLRLWTREQRNAKKVDLLLMRIPVIGELIRNLVLTRVLRTLSSLLESGVSILTCLELSKAAANNWVFHDILEHARVELREGKPLSGTLSGNEHIPPVLVSMISTGERTGTLPEVIDRVAGFYETETDTAIRNLFAAIEPIFIVGLGIMVGGIAVSVLLPMFDIAGAIQ